MMNERQADAGGATSSPERPRLNYFDYFTEIEETFIRRRGKHLLLSPIDWALMQSWKELGVPLHVALRGIEQSFDSYEAKPRPRSVKTLLYCQEEVEAQFAEWRESQLGAATVNADDVGDATTEAEARLPFPRQTILEHLAHARKSLSAICVERTRRRVDEFCETLTRVAGRLEELEKDFARAASPDAEMLEASLTSLEGLLDASLRASLSQEELKAAHAETETQLRLYRSRMEQATYEQTFDNLLLKRLREQHGVPRLSLFYL